MTFLFGVTRRQLFGAGGTLGGVKKVASTKLSYTGWGLKSETRDLCSHLHHPLVLEYFVRLFEKKQFLDVWLEQHVGHYDDHPLMNKVDGSSFDMIRWNTMYRDDLEVAEKLATSLKALDENLGLKEQLQQKSDRTDSDAELLDMVSDDIKATIGEIESLSPEVDQIMEKRLGFEDVVGSSSRTWKVVVSGKAGGEEASLFAGELAEMFRIYAQELRDMRVRLLGADESEEKAGVGFEVTGENVYRYFHHEIGVHKVQRVPVTDAAGKMQTSTAVVTMMPVLDPVSVNVHESDCKIDFVRGSGPGGQGMQSSSNCVVLTHTPTGISVKCHQTRSALGNKDLALQMVAQQILSRRVKDQNSSLHDAWTNQWSSGERSDKMRTYNFPQNRITDHRLGKDYPLRTFMERGSGLKDLHNELNDINDRQSLNSVLLKYIVGDFGSVV